MGPRAGDTPFRRPESVLVVIHTSACDCLLLERVMPPDFWQSVTGSLHWDESPGDAAAREVLEETGIDATRAGELSDGGFSQSFAILPDWRDRYAPGVDRNLEHVWYLCVDRRPVVRLDPDEHRAAIWLPLREARLKVASWTNREALDRLAGA